MCACCIVFSVTFMWPCIVTNFFLIKLTDALPISGSSSAHHQEFSTVHSTLVYVMQVWWQLSRTTILVLLESCHQTCMTYTSAESTVENSWWWAEELPEIGTVSWQNKFGKSVRLLVLLKSIIVCLIERLRWSRGSVLAFSTQVRGFKPGRSRRIFKGRKKSSARLPSDGK